MNADYRVKEIFTDENTGDVIALCLDVLYGETFEKFLGQGDTFDGKENASNLLKDSNYEISDEIRADIEDIFGVKEFDDEQDYDGYQFYDFGDDEEDEDEEDFAVPTKYLKRESFNLREALNTIDLNTYNKYDLLNLYEACDLSENEKRALANIVYDQEDPSVIYDTLNDRFLGKEIEMPERVKDGVIHETTESEFHRLKKLYKNYSQFKDIDTESGMIQDLVADLKNKGVSFEEYKHKTDNGITIFYDNMNESKSIKEDFYRGNKSVQYIGHGEWSDPELEYDGYLFNYWSIEDALWDAFLEETGYSDTQSDDPKVEEEFNAYVKERCMDYLNDCIYGGAFTGLSVEGEIMNFPNDDYFYVGYDYKTEELSLDNAYNTGRTPEYSIKYDFSKSVDENLQRLYDHAIEKSPWLNGDEDLDESVEDEPYTKEQIEQDLKSITKNFTSKEGELKCGFVEEKNSAVEILKQHYKVVETSGDDRRDGTWYHISFANPIEDKSIDEGYELLNGNKVEVYSDYNIAKKRAEELGLKEAEYGDIYRSNYSYCYWNESGDRNDDEQVIAYYAFEDGKSRPLTEDEREEVISKYEIGSFDNETLEEDTDAQGVIQRSDGKYLNLWDDTQIGFDEDKNKAIKDSPDKLKEICDWLNKCYNEFVTDGPYTFKITN